MKSPESAKNEKNATTTYTVLTLIQKKSSKSYSFSIKHANGFISKEKTSSAILFLPANISQKMGFVLFMTNGSPYTKNIPCSPYPANFPIRKIFLHQDLHFYQPS